MIATDLHADTLRIIDRLRLVPRGGEITLNSVSSVIGADIRQRRHLLYSAFRHVEKNDGAVFVSVRGKGYRRMQPDEIVKVGQTARSRIRSTARRGIKTIAAGIERINDLPEADRRKALSEQSALGLLEHIARERSLPVVPAEDTRPLPVAVAARAFLDIIGAKA